MLEYNISSLTLRTIMNQLHLIKSTVAEFLVDGWSLVKKEVEKRQREKRLSGRWKREKRESYLTNELFLSLSAERVTGRGSDGDADREIDRQAFVLG